MAASVGKQKRKKKSKDKKTTDFPDDSVSFICSSLGGDWFSFGKAIGFDHDHLQQLRELHPTDNEKCAQEMIGEWKKIAGNHTTKLFALLYSGLSKVRPDLAEELLKRSSTDKPSANDRQSDLWNDLTIELRKINFSPGDIQGSNDGSGTINLYNCSNIVIGPQGKIIVRGSNDDHQPCDEDIVKYLKGILLNYTQNNLHKGMNLQKLEAKFQECHKDQTFYQLMGKKLKIFLEERIDDFEVLSQNKQLFVHLKTPFHGSSYSPSPSVSSSVPSEYDELEYSEWTTVETRRKKRMNSCKRFQKQLPMPKNEKRPFLKENIAKKCGINSPNESKATYANITKKNIPAQKVGELHERKHPHLQSQETSSEDEGLSHSSDVKDFFKFVKNFTRGHFVLFASQREMVKYRDRLALIPWLCVFDFDEHSRSDGLLSVLEDKMKNSRALYVCTWKDHPRISHHGTQWCLIRGSVQEADSRTDPDTKAWFKTIRIDLEKHMYELASFADNCTTLKVIIIWPDEPNDAEYFQRALNKLDEFVDDYTTIILDSCRKKLESENAIMKMLKPDFVLANSLHNICKGIHELLGATKQTSRFEYKLPTADERNSPQIDESTASLLREDLDVLYLDNPFGETDLEVLKKEDEAFYKGGNLSWKTFYCFGAGHLDAERDLMNEIVNKIRDYIENFKSGLITIYHAPGSGCTTMVRRMLWELKSKTPCAQVRLNQRSNLQIVSQQIETLYDKTNLPIVLLVDGDDQQRVNHLYKLIDHSHMVVILINTKRYPYRIKELILKENHFVLDGVVSINEASKLWKKFEEKCDTDKKKDNLSQIVEDVRRGVRHSVYEFGLATYLNNYKGIDAYIAGYLKVDHRAGLQPHHKILGYLSLVQYYGHTSIPCQFFVNLLGLSSKSDVTFDDFPFQVQMFAVPCRDEAKGNSIRLCHYVVAKGILEYILSSPNAERKKESRDKLSPSARENLYNFVVGFIDDIKARRSKGVVKANILSDILTRTIIFRDNRDIGENELQQRARRPNLSRLLLDIDSKPPYLERVNLIKKLTEAFPEDPSFHSHLGRMYSLCMPDDEKKAEKCFEHALDLCNLKTFGVKFEDLDESTKHTLKHVFHMAGMFYLQRISKYTGRTHGDKPEKKTTKEEFKSRLQELLFFSERACKYFSETRELTMFGYIEAHGFVGEISVRIRLCEFIHRHLSDRKFDSLLTKKESDSEEAKYVQDSVIQIQELFLQCYGTIDIDELPQDFFDSIHWYSALFKDHAPILENLNLSDNIYQRRLKVAAIKLRYGKDEMLGSLENINNPNDIAEIVRICEMNFKDTRLHGLQQSRRALDLEYKDWINAVRHELFKTVYLVEDVIEQVRYWNNTLQSPNSKFYQFIMLSILGFGLNGSPNDEMLREAHGLQDQLKKLSKHLVKPRKPREWLGRGPGLKDILLQGRKVHRNDEDGLSAQREGGHYYMTVLKGTISKPNIQRQTGYIQLDLGDKNRFPVKVFFVPVRQNPPLVGRRYAGERVEFVMAFTNADGYEAYNVMQLEKFGCECGLKVEIQSDEYIGTCKCGKKVPK